MPADPPIHDGASVGAFEAIARNVLDGAMAERGFIFSRGPGRRLAHETSPVYNMSSMVEYRSGERYITFSASYFWSGGMNAYADPLFAFMEIADGKLTVEGVASKFVKPPPAESDSVIGRSASIQDRSIKI